MHTYISGTFAKLCEQVSHFRLALGRHAELCGQDDDITVPKNNNVMVKKKKSGDAVRCCRLLREEDKNLRYHLATMPIAGNVTTVMTTVHPTNNTDSNLS